MHGTYKRRARAEVRAIDLYAGIGGWSVGLKLAGVEVVASYEWWSDANAAHSKNMDANVVEVDIRALPLSALPKNIDIVVGSPPCTQFSYANRGGSGDIEDGFKDILKFFQIVHHLKPKFWAMENVPRVAKLLQDESIRRYVLGKLSYLLDDAHIAVVDCSDFGTPQKRKRCIVGNFDFELFRSYGDRTPPLSLGDVLSALDHSVVRDPNYGIEIPRGKVTGLSLEATLSDEELRMNRDAKTHHPVYNNMPFPDPLNSPSRTITATCTRVSRESVVVEFPPGRGTFRRLSVRERATAQGFPVFYQFHARSYASQLKMIGNAIPPNVTYAIANAMLSVPANEFVPTQAKGMKIPEQSELAPEYEPETPGRKFRRRRSFAAAIPSLRFKSGMRFELNNEKGTGRWSVQFFFGDSKSIHSVPLDQSIVEEAIRAVEGNASAERALSTLRQRAKKIADRFSHDLIQSVWVGTAQGTHPHDLVDELAVLAADAIRKLSSFSFDARVDGIIVRSMGGTGNFIGRNKIARHSTEVLVGMLLGGVFNSAVAGRD